MKHQNKKLGTLPTSNFFTSSSSSSIACQARSRRLLVGWLAYCLAIEVAEQLVSLLIVGLNRSLSAHAHLEQNSFNQATTQLASRD